MSENKAQWICVECDTAFTLSRSAPHRILLFQELVVIDLLPMCPDCWRESEESPDPYEETEAAWRARGGLTHAERADRGLPDLRYPSV